MTKKNLQADVTVRVLGKDLTKAEAEELYAALGSALGKSPMIQYIYRDGWARPYWGGYSHQLCSGSSGSITTNSAVYGDSQITKTAGYNTAIATSAMVELIEAETDGA
jgi:hypothetical protein